ncbi:MAG: pyridoxal 5'-phosphate synthase glutaminase subunit PdxT [Sulfolobaceae archaeon]
MAYQGSFEEHGLAVIRASKNLGLSIQVVPIKKPSDLKEVDGIIIPGGESTTIGILASRLGVLELLRELIISGLPVMGTCAGAIMLAKEVSDAKVGKKSQPLLGVMDMEVIRNFYGRQRESFEAFIDLSEIGLGRVRAPFIRAPAIIRVWNDAKALAKLNDVIVMARQKNMLATTFHPELSSSTSIHEYFLSMIKK